MPVAPPSAPARRVDGSMSLLVDMMDGTLDSSYVEAARRRAGEQRAEAAGGPPVRRRTVVPLLLVLGVLTGTAAAQVRSRAADAGSSRDALAAEVGRRTQQSDVLADQVQQLRARLAQEQAAALSTSASGRRAAARLADLELAAATVPVEGPGVVVRLDDASEARQAASRRGGQLASGRVLDVDLQAAVNGLWAAGAEAVSVNGLRLDALTAIRSAAEAVLVDFKPLTPPYVVRAVGHPDRLRSRFTTGPDGRRLATFPQRYGISFEVREADDLRLPAAGVPELRAVQPS